MADDIHEFCVRVDRSKPIEPQVIYWRHQRVPWWMLIKLTGLTKRQLERRIAGWIKRQAGAVVSPELLALRR